MELANNSPRPVLVIDFGAQYAQLITRRVREARIYSELIPHTMPAKDIIAEQVAEIQQRVGNRQVICGLSGGVDSAVAAALVYKAIGDQLTCVLLITGCCALARPNR